GGQVVCKSHSLVEGERLLQMTWDVKAYKGKKASIRIVDNQRGPWGHILVDDIAMSDNKKSIFMVDYELTFDANRRYLLLPIEDNGPESEVQLKVDGKNSGEPMHIRVAQTHTDYWIPIDISAYKGKKVALKFAHVKKTDTGFSQIKLSDSFDFNYQETYRPIYHLSPDHGWMNDPNGMVYLDGEYHLFFQYNPYGSRWANMHWGHFVSKDLTNWQMLPVALAPDSLGAIFSGSAVVDKDNTAGFGKNALVAIYTSAGKSQRQSIAYSLDKGRSFKKYEGNPVLSDPGIADFRDPKVFWHEESHQWVMALATSQTISFYGSPNLKNWKKLSEFGSGMGAHGGVWECPDLIQLPYGTQKKWALLVSINPGGPNGGSATQYFIGDFDGKSFHADNLPYPLWLDYGRDNYAGVTWSNIPPSEGRCLLMGWMNNWDYANLLPQTDFRGAMTLPRELKLIHNGKHLILANCPAKEIEALRKDKTTFVPIEVDKTQSIKNLVKDNKGAYEIEMTLKPENSTLFSFALANNKGEKVDFQFDLPNGHFTVDRSKSGNTAFSASFAPRGSQAPFEKKTSYKFQILVDKSSIECFVDNGEVVQTNSVFPTEAYNSLEFKSNSNITINNLTVYKIK
ncbi:MAG: invertase, partial [Bacteroidales bacterium 45-6]